MTIGKSVKSIVEQGKKAKVSKTSFNADIEEYKKFKRWCEKNGRTTSEVLNALIKDFNVYTEN